MQLEQHTKGSSVMELPWQNRNLKAPSSPSGLQAEENGTQKGQKLSLKAKAVSMAREEEQREKEHRHSAETALRKCVREATQNYRTDQSLCRLWTGTVHRGVGQRGPAPRALGRESSAGPGTAMELSEGGPCWRLPSRDRAVPQPSAAEPAGASAHGTGGTWSLTLSPAGRKERPGAAGGSCGPRAGPALGSVGLPATAGTG